MKLTTGLFTVALAALTAQACSHKDDGDNLIEKRLADRGSAQNVQDGASGATAFAVPPVETKSPVDTLTLEVKLEGAKDFERVETVPYQAGALESFDKHAPGVYDVTVSILNANGEAEYVGRTTVDIEAGETSVAHMTLVQIVKPETDGGLVLDLATDTLVVDACQYVDTKTPSIESESESELETYKSTRTYAIEGYFCAVVVGGDVHIGDVSGSYYAARQSLLSSLCNDATEVTKDHLDAIQCTVAIAKTSTPAAPSKPATSSL
jgi:hypothetical protein